MYEDCLNLDLFVLEFLMSGADFLFDLISLELTALLQSACLGEDIAQLLLKVLQLDCIRRHTSCRRMQGELEMKKKFRKLKKILPFFESCGATFGKSFTGV